MFASQNVFREKYNALMIEQGEAIKKTDKYFWQFFKRTWIWDKDQVEYLCQEKVEVSPLVKSMLQIQDLNMEATRRKKSEVEL